MSRSSKAKTKTKTKTETKTTLAKTKTTMAKTKTSKMVLRPRPVLRITSLLLAYNFKIKVVVLYNKILRVSLNQKCF